MSRRDLIDQVADIVGSAHDPKRLAELAVEIVMSLSHAQRGAVFAIEPEGLVLCAGMGLDQAVLDATHAVWNDERATLNQGQMSVRPLAGRAGHASAILPLRQGDTLKALLYLDGTESSFVPAVKEGRVVESTKVVLRALERGAFPATARPVPKDWEDYLASDAGGAGGPRPADRAARPQRVEHRPRRAPDARHAPDDLPAPRPLRRRAQARPQDGPPYPSLPRSRSEMTRAHP